jgi:hypothetical protein
MGPADMVAVRSSIVSGAVCKLNAPPLKQQVGKPPRRRGATPEGLGDLFALTNDLRSRHHLTPRMVEESRTRSSIDIDLGLEVLGRSWPQCPA